MTKHTPGPWRLSGDLVLGANEPRPNPKVVPYAHRVAVLCHDEASNGDLPWLTAEANGRLITAAPEMLEALKGILNSFHESVKTTASLDEFPSLKAVQAAIAKAQGTTE